MKAVLRETFAKLQTRGQTLFPFFSFTGFIFYQKDVSIFPSKTLIQMRIDKIIVTGKSLPVEPIVLNKIHMKKIA